MLWSEFCIKKTDTLRIHSKYQDYRYVDDLPIFKAQKIIIFFCGCPTIKLTKIIADTIWIHYAYLRRFMNVKLKTQKEVNHENFSSCKNLDRLPCYQFQKKIPSVHRWIINKFCTNFGGEDLTELSSEKILHFFNIVTEGCKPQTKRVRVSHGFEYCQSLGFIARLSKKSYNCEFSHFACNKINSLQISK